MRSPMEPEELRRYAETIVRGCIAFRRGDTLIEQVSLGHRELAVAVAETAYRAGALAVDVVYEDNRVYAAKIEHGSRAALRYETPWRAAWSRALGDESVAIVQVMGEFEQDVVAALPPEKVAADHAARSPHLGPDDPPGDAGWTRHLASLRRRAKRLTTLDLKPDAAATEGVFRCSRPRSFGGRMLEGLAGEFRRPGGGCRSLPTARGGSEARNAVL